jgi:hypothetical protein
MKNLMKLRTLLVMAALMLTVGSLDALSQTRRRPTVRRGVKRTTVRPTVKYYSVQSGTVIRSRINETLSSKTARVGDTFTATVTEPVYSTTGVIVVPVGSTVNGRIDSVVQARKGGNPGQISASFVSVRLPNGTTRAINGSLTDLSSGKTTSDNEGTASAKKMGNRKLIFIGGGTAGGAVLGGAIGGGKGALIGGLLGAAGGLAGERLTKGADAEVKSGTEFGVYLNQAISLPKFAENGSM